MKGWSIFAGRLFGVELRIHLSFLLLLLFVLLTESFRPGGGGTGAARGFGLVALIFGSVVLHELGHAVVATRHGVRVRGILLLPIGGLTLMDPQEQMESAKNPARETRIAIAGPAVNVVLAVISGVVLMGLLPRPGFFDRPLITTQALPRSFFWTNIFLFAFNLLPAFPMDGGRVLRAWLARRMDFQQATQRAVKVGHAFAIAFMLLGASAWTMSTQPVRARRPAASSPSPGRTTSAGPTGRRTRSTSTIAAPRWPSPSSTCGGTRTRAW